MSAHGSAVVDVVVIGGGIAGLAAAHSAQRAGASVVVLEAGEQVGGVMQTESRDGFLVEHGPTSMTSSEQLLNLLNEIGLSSQILSPDAAAEAPIRREGWSDARVTVVTSGAAQVKAPFCACKGAFAHRATRSAQFCSGRIVGITRQAPPRRRSAELFR